MKRIHIFLLIVTAILGFISCDIRSELIGPLNYADTLYVYHKDTVYISTVDTVYVDCNCEGNTGDDNTGDPGNGDNGSDTDPDINPDNGGQNPPSEPVEPKPEEPAVPVETVTITLDFATANPFTSDLPAEADKEKHTYTITDSESGSDYTFTIYNPTTGFFYSAKNGYLRLMGLTGDKANQKPGYVQLPGIPEYQLMSVEVTGANSSGVKTYEIRKHDPIDGTSTDGDPLAFVKVSGKASDTITLLAGEPGYAYYLTVMGTSSDQNAQFSKLVLTYGKFE